MKVSSNVTSASTAQVTGRGAAGKLAEKGKAAGTEFSKLLQAGQGRAPDASTKGAVEKQLQGFFDSWKSANDKSAAQLRNVPKASRDLIQLQISVCNLGLKTQVVTKVGEAFTGTIRTVQQLGNS